MPAPTITGFELTSGSEVALTTDPLSPAYNEFAIYGSNLADTTTVSLNSGSSYTWQVASMSASSNSIVVTAYAYGQSSSSGSVVASATTPQGTATSPIIEAPFTELTLID